MVSFDGLLQIYKTDTDNAYGIQCMDLMHVYIKYVLGLEDLSILAAPNAKSVWLNFKSEWAKYFIKIPNTPCVLGRYRRSCGHIYGRIG
jgi:hypothetical protein